MASSTAPQFTYLVVGLGSRVVSQTSWTCPPGGGEDCVMPFFGRVGPKPGELVVQGGRHV